MNEQLDNLKSVNQAASAHHRIRMVMFFVVAIAGLIPVGIYSVFFGRVPTISAEKAERLLTENSSAVVLVDVRPADEYRIRHLPAAISWPLEKIQSVRNQTNLPAEMKGKKLLLICASGITSGCAAEKLTTISGVEAYSIQGGMQAFGAGRELKCAARLLGSKRTETTVGSLPFRESTAFEQWTAVLTGFVVKPTYTLLSFLYIILLWRCKAPDLTALRGAMIAFFFGENFCAANYLFCQDGSYLLEYLHIFGMLLCFGLIVFALLEGIDRRLFKYSDPNSACAALGLCRGCIKYAEVPCRLQRLFLWILPALMILSFMPLTAKLLPISYNTQILGTLYNYSHAVVHQIYEIRILPFMALVLFAISWCLLKYKRFEPVAWSKAFFSAGMGALGFSLFRMILLHAYCENMTWFAAWEEITELIFILGTGIMLAIFWQGLVVTDHSINDYHGDVPPIRTV
jgi:rhodanese-related sulfurtransferase